MKLNYKRFLKNRLVKKQRPDFEQVGHQIQRSLKGLKTAEANLSIDLTWSFELSSYGIGFKSATEPFDTTTSAGRLMFQQLGSFAEFERNRIAERIFPGTVKSVQQGNWQGARYAPYGYKYNKGRKLLEIDEKERA